MNRTRWLFLVVAVVAMAASNGCVVETSCTDDNNNGICDIDEGGCIDDDLDGFCWIDDCDDLDANIGPCSGCIDDFDCDGESDLTDCYDDYLNEYVCSGIVCTDLADNYCTDSWYLVYCSGGAFYGADCNTSCTTDQATWEQACSAPALAGECGAAEGACLCWCEDSFDSCVNDFTVQYTREGTTYQVDCKTYCGGTCDAGTGACACP